jgi:lambda family phage minor tail protein L
MLSTQTITDKNALSTNAVFLVLLEIQIPDTPIVRLVNNTEDITWDSELWQNFPFTLEDISQGTDGSVPSWVIKISNVNRAIEQYLQQYDLYLKQNGIDGNEITCIIRVVNSKDLGNTEPITEHTAILNQPTTDPQWATFKLSAKSPYNKQFPPRKVLKSFCAWQFKSEQCGYTGTATSCDKTLTNCRLLDNSPRFGGFPGVLGRGLILV